MKQTSIFLIVILYLGIVTVSISAMEVEARGIRILPGQWRPHYPFEQIAWVSPPWASHDYIWMDFPEAIFTESGLLYLSHVNPTFPVMFPDLPKAQWQQIPKGLAFERTLPNGIRFGGSLKVGADSNSVALELYIYNGSDKPLKDIKLQTCAYLRAIKEFGAFREDNKFIHLPESGWQSFDKARALTREKGTFRMGWRRGPAIADLPVIVTIAKRRQRLVAFTWYDDTYSLVQNPGHPCMHADPHFPDIRPGAKKTIKGELIFFEGSLEEFDKWFDRRYN